MPKVIVLNIKAENLLDTGVADETSKQLAQARDEGAKKLAEALAAQEAQLLVGKEAKRRSSISAKATTAFNKLRGRPEAPMPSVEQLTQEQLLSTRSAVTKGRMVQPIVGSFITEVLDQTDAPAVEALVAMLVKNNHLTLGPRDGEWEVSFGENVSKSTVSTSAADYVGDQMVAAPLKKGEKPPVPISQPKASMTWSKPAQDVKGGATSDNINTQRLKVSMADLKGHYKLEDALIPVLQTRADKYFDYARAVKIETAKQLLDLIDKLQALQVEKLKRMHGATVARDDALGPNVAQLKKILVDRVENEAKASATKKATQRSASAVKEYQFGDDLFSSEKGPQGVRKTKEKHGTQSAAVAQEEGYDFSTHTAVSNNVHLNDNLVLSVNQDGAVEMTSGTPFEFANGEGHKFAVFHVLLEGEDEWRLATPDILQNPELLDGISYQAHDNDTVGTQIYKDDGVWETPAPSTDYKM